MDIPEGLKKMLGIHTRKKEAIFLLKDHTEILFLTKKLTVAGQATDKAMRELQDAHDKTKKEIWKEITDRLLEKNLIVKGKDDLTFDDGAMYLYVKDEE